MTRWIRVAAGATAFLFLSMQIIAAYEYADSGSTYALASMIAALIGLAVIPIIVIAALQAGHIVAAGALSLTVVCLLAYTLPATVGRSAHERERLATEKAAQATDKSKINQALKDMQAECATGDGRRCKGKRAVYDALAGRASEIKLGDIGTAILAWALGVSEDVLRKLSALAIALGYDIGICALSAVAGYRKVKHKDDVKTPPPPRPRKKKAAPVEPAPSSLGNSWLATFLRENPKADPEKARMAYEQEMAGKPGRRMSERKFREQFREMAA